MKQLNQMDQMKRPVSTRRACCRNRWCATALCLALATAWCVRSAAAANYELVAQDLDSQGEGYTLLRVWGTAEEMGYAQGQALAQEIMAGVSQIKGIVGAIYPAIRNAVQATLWKPPEIEQELAGMVAGIKAAQPGAAVDVLDLKVINSFGDWAYGLACRSHSTWGSFVKAPTTTLSSRRLDLAISVDIPAIRHHVLVAREQAGGVRWVNLAWPGYVTAITAVNEYGTQASLHNYSNEVSQGAHLPRCVAVRHALTLVKGLPLDQHLDAVYTELQQHTIMTTTFINYFVPEGHGGVITCLAGKPCSKKRVPQPGYFGGEVLITTNDETDGSAVPPGGAVFHGYYAQGGVKTLADHYASLSQGLLSNAPPIHRMSVDYRARGEMTIWAEGLVSGGATPVIKVEFEDLFGDQPLPPPVDSGVIADSGTAGDGAGPPSDSGVASDGGTAGDGSVVGGDGATGDGASGDGKTVDGGGGCGCRTSSDGARTGLGLLALLLVVAVWRRRHGRG